MTRWTEEREGYRVVVRRGGLGILYGAVAAGAAGHGVWLVVICLGSLDLDSMAERLKWAAGLLFATWAFAGLCFAQGRRYWRERGWVVLSIGGGRAQWAGTDWREVKLFDLLEGPDGELSVCALQADGGRQRVLGPWYTHSPTAMARLVEQLNAGLGTVASGEATLHAPEVRFDPSLTEAEIEALRAWAAGDAPYRVETSACPNLGPLWGVPLLPAAFVAANHARLSTSAMLALVACAAAALTPLCWFAARKLWIEVLARGGPVRWGRGRRVLSPHPVRVASFDTQPETDPTTGVRYRLLCAHLPDGDRLYPFDLAELEPGDACRMAAMLNAVLLPPPSA